MICNLDIMIYLQGATEKFQNFIKKKTKNFFSFANILLVAFEKFPFALNPTICTIKKIIEWFFRSSFGMALSMAVEAIRIASTSG